MDLHALDKFLDSLDAAPEYLREHIRRQHAGDRPLWRIDDVWRGDNCIVEVAEDLRTHRHVDRYAVITWYWSAQHHGMRWTTFETLADARKHRDRMFSIDTPPDNIRA